MTGSLECHRVLNSHSRVIGWWLFIKVSHFPANSARLASVMSGIHFSTFIPGKLKGKSACSYHVLFAYRSSPAGLAIHLIHFDKYCVHCRDENCKTYIPMLLTSANLLNFLSNSWACLADAESCSESCCCRRISCSKSMIEAAEVSNCRLNS